MRRYVVAGSVVLLAIALLGACGGSEKSPSASPDTNGDTSSSQPGNSSGDSDLAKLIADSQAARFKITYTTDGGEASTYAQDGQGNSVWTTGTSQYFVTSDGTVSCDTDSEGKATCTQIPGTGAAANPFLGLFQTGKTYIDALGGNYGDASSETIADRDAKCVTISAKSVAGGIGAALGGKASAKVCVDQETGVLLEISGTDTDGKNSTAFKATEFSVPSDADFEPPATPETIPGYTVPTIPGGG